MLATPVVTLIVIPIVVLVTQPCAKPPLAIPANAEAAVDRILQCVVLATRRTAGVRVSPIVCRLRSMLGRPESRRFRAPEVFHLSG